MERKLEIRIKDGKYGVVDAAAEHIVIPFKYDNIFLIGSVFNSHQMFILHKAGKIGAIYVNGNNICKWIAPCEYDYFHNCGGNFLFYNHYEARCYFSGSGISKTFLNAEYIEDSERYIFARDDKFYYVLHSDTGKTLWQNSIYDPKYDCGVPCLRYMGEVDDLPLFNDYRNSGQIYPNREGVLEYGYMGDVIKPIIIGDINIVTIVDWVGVINIRRETYEEIRNDFHDVTELTIELKVNLKKGEHTEERIYQIPNGRFNSDFWNDPNIHRW